jgi:hypothetical protein
VILSGLRLNISGMVGPAPGGPLIGTNFVFVANAACFLRMETVEALKASQQDFFIANVPVWPNPSKFAQLRILRLDETCHLPDQYRG